MEQSLLYLQTHHKMHNSRNLTNGINPLKIDIKYIRHAYNLHIGVGMKFQGRPRRQRR